MVVAATDALGALDVLVNNAGIAGPTAPVEEADPEQWEEEVRAGAMGVQSIKRCVDAKDIAALAAFLASDSGKSISGQVLPIDNDAQTSA